MLLLVYGYPKPVPMTPELVAAVFVFGLLCGVLLMGIAILASEVK